MKRILTVALCLVMILPMFAYAPAALAADTEAFDTKTLTISGLKKGGGTITFVMSLQNPIAFGVNETSVTIASSYYDDIFVDYNGDIITYAKIEIKYNDHPINNKLTLYPRLAEPADIKITPGYRSKTKPNSYDYGINSLNHDEKYEYCVFDYSTGKVTEWKSLTPSALGGYTINTDAKAAVTVYIRRPATTERPASYPCVLDSWPDEDEEEEKLLPPDFKVNTLTVTGLREGYAVSLSSSLGSSYLPFEDDGRCAVSHAYDSLMSAGATDVELIVYDANSNRLLTVNLKPRHPKPTFTETDFDLENWTVSGLTPGVTYQYADQNVLGVTYSGAEPNFSGSVWPAYNTVTASKDGKAKIGLRNRQNGYNAYLRVAGTIKPVPGAPGTYDATPPSEPGDVPLAVTKYELYPHLLTVKDLDKPYKGAKESISFDNAAKALGLDADASFEYVIVSDRYATDAEADEGLKGKKWKKVSLKQNAALLSKFIPKSGKQTVYFRVSPQSQKTLPAEYVASRAGEPPEEFFDWLTIAACPVLDAKGLKVDYGYDDDIATVANWTPFMQWSEKPGRDEPYGWESTVSSIDGNQWNPDPAAFAKGQDPVEIPVPDMEDKKLNIVVRIGPASLEENLARGEYDVITPASKKMKGLSVRAPRREPSVKVTTKKIKSLPDANAMSVKLKKGMEYLLGEDGEWTKVEEAFILGITDPATGARILTPNSMDPVFDPDQGKPVIPPNNRDTLYFDSSIYVRMAASAKAPASEIKEISESVAPIPKALVGLRITTKDVNVYMDGEYVKVTKKFLKLKQGMRYEIIGGDGAVSSGAAVTDKKGYEIDFSELPADTKAIAVYLTTGTYLLPRIFYP